MTTLSELMSAGEQPELSTRAGDIQASDKFNSAAYISMVKQKEPSYFEDKPLPIAGAPVRLASGALSAVSDAPSDIKEGLQGVFQKGLVEPFRKAGSRTQEGIEALSTGEFSPVQSAAIPIAIAEGAANAAFEGIKTVGKIMLTPEQEKKVASKFGELTETIGNTRLVKKAVESWNNLDEQTQESLEAASFIAEALTGGVAGKAVRQAVPKIELPKLPKITSKTKPEKFVAGIEDTKRQAVADSLSNSLNKVDPARGQEAFTKISGGQTVGSYLNEVGATGTRQENISTLVNRYRRSKSRVDQLMAKGKKEYQSPEFKEAIELLDGEIGKRSKDRARFESLSKKFEEKGLTIREENELKRIYERNIALAHKQDVTKTSKQKSDATDLDNALREGVLSRAEREGITGIRDLNKETQKARFAADAIAGKKLRQEANNTLTLTDTIDMAGMTAAAATSPAFLAAYGIKKLAGATCTAGALAA